MLPISTITYDYDGFYRASYDVEVSGSDILTTDYTFLDGITESSTTMLVDSMTTSGSDWSETLSYTYDCKGNVETISENGEQKAKYYYDALNQLVREDNAWTNKTVVYTYDNGGNILSVSEYSLTSASDISALVALSTDIYAYTDSNWKDKLTTYNGNTITYDEIGNPLTYYDGKVFTWQNGRQLANVSGNGLNISYTYNADGIRTSKIINGVTTTYILESGNVIKETNGIDEIWYYYDETNNIVSFELNGTPYFYIKNVQGDIVAITDANGNIVVEYTYDSWGAIVSITGTLADTVGIKNSYRYRGYYYDAETSLYYLNSRYYDSAIGRFINADLLIANSNSGVQGFNLFAYSVNNPINMSDKSGCWPLSIKESMTRLIDKISSIKEKFIIKHKVPMYTQQEKNLCWAYSQAMIESYNSGSRLTQEQANERAKELAISVNGADRWDTGAFPTNSGDAVFVDMFELYHELEDGPVYGYYWGESGSHCVVITGVDLIRGDVYINDPAGFYGFDSYNGFLNRSWAKENDIELYFSYIIRVN